MPKFSISAHGAVLPDLTRRSLLVGTAAAATSPGIPPAAAACSAPSDCVVAILTQRLTAALTDYAVAERHRNDCERRYLDDGPMPPAALTRAGPLGSRLREWEWWTADDLCRFLENGARRKHWPIARELLHLARAHEMADKRFAHACGLAAAEAAHDAAAGTLHRLADMILAVPPHSRAAFVLKAGAVRAGGRREWWGPPHGGADAYERMVAQVLDAVIAEWALPG